MKSIQDEPFEVKELIKVNYDKCFPDHAESKLANNKDANWFLEKAKQSLVVALRNDRLSILNNPEQERFGPEDLSPETQFQRTTSFPLCLKDSNLSAELSYANVISMSLPDGESFHFRATASKRLATTARPLTHW
jgi:hypothetical protein